MTKQDLQKELKARVKPGIKPSQLRKSKSEGDMTMKSSFNNERHIPKAPPLPNLQRSKSAQELEPSPQATREQLETKISALELKLEVGSRELGEVQAEKQILTEQLTLKQKALEELRKALEEQNALIQTANQELTSLKSQHSNLLDHNLALKHQSLKDWFQQYQKTQKLEEQNALTQKELASNIDYASNELTQQDQRIASLQTENKQLKQQNQSLTKDLNLAHKLTQLRGESWPTSDWPTFPWGWSLISLTLIFLTLWILTHD